MKSGIGLIAGPVLGLLATLICSVASENTLVSRVLGICLWMIVWWLSECVPMGATGLLPIVLLPLLGISKAGEISSLYFSDTVIVCWSSMVMTGAIERYKLHIKLADRFVSVLLQLDLSFLLLGFILLTGFLSMWMSNTATAALMCPLARAVFADLKKHRRTPPIIPSTKDSETEEKASSSTEDTNALLSGAATAVDLGISIAASLGGMATLTGTGSNLVLQGTLTSMFGDESGISFLLWMMIASPLALLNLLFVWMVLWWQYIRPYRQDLNAESTLAPPSANALWREGEEGFDAGIELSPPRQSLRGQEEPEEYSLPRSKQLEFSYAEYNVLIAFITMAALWITRDPPGGWGWSLLLPRATFVTDGTVAMGCCVYLLCTPKRPPQSLISAWKWLRESICGSAYGQVLDMSARGSPESPQDRREELRSHETDNEMVLDWVVVQKLNWNIIFLLGGGFALSKGFQDSGLSVLLTESILAIGLKNIHALVVVASVSSCIVTNVVSNIATANIFLPSLACVGPSRGLAPIVVLAPASFSISLALLFPIGTPPNAIVIANGNVSLRQMACTGLVCTVVVLTSLLLYCSFILPLIYGPIDRVSEGIKQGCGLS